MNAPSFVTPQFLFALVLDVIALKNALGEGDDDEVLFRANTIEDSTRDIGTLIALRRAVAGVAFAVRCNAALPERERAEVKLAEAMDGDLHLRL